MTQQRTVWTLKNRQIEPRTSEVLAIGLNVAYLDRECDIGISLPRTVDGQTPETELALDELRRLRDALNDILDAQ